MNGMTSEEVLAKYLETPGSDLLAVLYQRMRRKMLSVAIRILRSREDAEDVVQDVFAKLCELDPQPIHSAESFLFKMVQNMAIDLRRHNRSGVRQAMVSIDAGRFDEHDGDGKRRHRSSFDLVDKKTLSVESQIQKNELFDGVTTAMNNLPERQREAIHLYHARGFTAAETGEMLGVSEDVVKYCVRQGISKLRDVLVDDDNRPALRARVRPIRATDPMTGVVVHEFPSTTDAIRAGNYPKCLYRALKQGRKYKGLHWSYANAV